MDITCPQCKTEYEFEDAKVTEAGITVKCTTCDFMFKVRRRAVVETEAVLLPPSGSAPTEPANQAARAWMIRTVGGVVLNFQELTTLQHWIVERKVSRDDHISRSGETWKRLGDIAELASFFQVVDAAVAAESSHRSAPAPRRSTQPLGVKPPASREPFEERDEPVSMGAPIHSDEPAFAAASSSGFQVVGPSAAWEEGGSRLSGRHAAVELGEEELPRHRTGRVMGIALVVLLLLGGAALAYYYRAPLSSLLGRNAGAANDQAFRSARKLFLQDDQESLAQADLEFARAGGQSALAEAGRAEVLATWAGHLRDQSSLLERRARLLERSASATAGPDSDPKALRLKASALREEADHKLAEAGVRAKRALELGADKAEVQRAMADYLRLAGRAPAEVLPFLTGVRKKVPEDPEALYVEGSYWSAQGNQARAEMLLKDALTRTRARYGQLLLRASFALGMLQLGADRRAEARGQAQAILEANPRHRWAQELLDTLRAEEQAPAVAQPGAADAAPAPVPAPAPGSGAGAGSGSASVEKPAGGGGTAAPEPPPTATYEQLVSLGDGLSEKGRTMQAFKLFERALKLRPNGIEALVGIGFCHLDQERFAAAISYFKRALNSAPTHGEALIGMGEAYKVQENPSKALDYYRAYLQAHPGGPKAVLARRNVGDLERKVAGSTPAPSPSPEPTPSPESPAPAPAPEPTPPPAPPPETTTP